MINWSVNDVIDELLSRAEREVTPVVYRTDFQRHYQARRSLVHGVNP